MDRSEGGGRRRSRRWFLGASASAAGFVVLRCGGGGKATPTSSGGTPDSPTATLQPGSSVTPTPAGDPSIRITGFVLGDGQFDPHRTQVGTVHGQQAFVYSRLLAFEDQAAGTLTPDLAVAMPEQPDELTYIFQVHPAARWHDVEPVNGRPVTADDVVQSFNRQRQGDKSVFVRQARWLNISSIEATAADTVTIKTEAPFAPMLNWLADANAYIVAPEQDREGFGFSKERQIGSGPFIWVEWDELNFASVARNENWHGGMPRLAGVTVAQPVDAQQVEGALRVKDLDAAFVGRERADALKQDVPELQEALIGNALFFGMRFFTPVAPFNDVRVRTALSVAINRVDLAEKLFQGSGEPSGWVSWPVKQWALPSSELSQWPGYRLGSGGRDEDIADARALLDAYVADGHERPASFLLFVEQTVEQTLNLGSLIARHVYEALGIPVEKEVVPINELVQRHFAGEAAWVAAPDNGWLDLDDWLFPYFHSQGTQNSFALRNEDLDAKIASQRAEFDHDARRQIGLDVQRQLLQINAGVNLISERVVALRRPYVRAMPLDIMDGYQDRFSDCWIDTSDPTFRGR